MTEKPTPVWVTAYKSCVPGVPCMTHSSACRSPISISPHCFYSPVGNLVFLDLPKPWVSSLLSWALRTSLQNSTFKFIENTMQQPLMAHQGLPNARWQAWKSRLERASASSHWGGVCWRKSMRVEPQTLGYRPTRRITGPHHDPRCKVATGFWQMWQVGKLAERPWAT